MLALMSQKQPEFCKIDVLKNLAKFPGMYICLSLCFNKVAGWRDSNFIK